MSIWNYSGYIRIHFNRKDEAPLLASITNHAHSWEVLATFVRIEGVYLKSRSDLENARPGLDPVWWLEGDATVTLDDNGIAHVGPITKPPQGVMSGLALDIAREQSRHDASAQGMSAGFATALHAEGVPSYSTYGYAVGPEKKRKTRKKAAKRRVHKSR